MIVAQISDTHIAFDTPDAERRLADFAATIADIDALDPLPDAVVHTGDIVHNGRADEYAAAASILAKARPPVHVLPGNKDDRANLRAAFPAVAARASATDFVQYAVDDFPVRLIALDTQCPGRNKGDFCRQRAAHLAELVAAGPARPIAVFAHHPPFEVTVGPERTHFESQEAMARLRDALRGSGRVVALFCGHVHRAAWGDVAGIPATVMPAVATTLRKGDYPEPMRTWPLYYVHRYDPAWGFSTEVRIVRQGN